MVARASALPSNFASARWTAGPALAPRAVLAPPAARRRTWALRASFEEEGGPADAAQPPPPPPPPTAEGSGNGGIAGAAVGFGVALFAVSRLGGGGISLEALAETSIPLDAALANGKPTIVEFYADWCEVCREMAPSVYSVESKYKDDVNFVMLNIDNSLWAPELEEYDVDGIPHFVFLGKDDKTQSVATGRLPAEVLEGNIEALAHGKDLPYNGVAGRQSAFEAAPVGSQLDGGADPLRGTVGAPRSHG